MNEDGDTISIVLTQEAEGMAKERTLSQVKDSGQFLYKKKKSGDNPRQEFFDLFVYLLSDPKKAEKAVSSVTTKNFTLDDDKQLNFDDILELKNVAYNYIEWYKANDIDEDSPIPLEYRHLASVNVFGNIEFDYQAMADHLLSMFNIVAYFGGKGDDNPDLYIYDESTGYYTHDSTPLKNEINRIANEIGFKGKITGATDQIMHYVSFDNPIRTYPFNEQNDLIPVKNGIIDIRNGDIKLIPHSPEHRFTCRIPIRYDPSANPDPIENMLKPYLRVDGTGKNDYKDYLYQIPAQSLLQGFCKLFKSGVFKQSCYLIQGAGNGGKSTYCNLLIRFFGKEFVAGECLQDLCGGSRFSSASLPGKFINIFDDLEDMDLKNVGRFKKLTGSRYHTVEAKGKQSKSEVIFCPHVFTCNRPPLLSNERIKTDEYWWRRWIYLCFNDSNFVIDPTYEDRLFTDENLSGFFNKVLEVVLNIKRDPTSFKKMDFEEVLSHWDKNSDSMASFINECFYETTERTPVNYDKERMKVAYLEFCKLFEFNDSHDITTIEKLTRRLHERGFIATRLRKKSFNSEVYQSNLRWQGPADIPDPTHEISVKTTGYNRGGFT